MKVFLRLSSMLLTISLLAGFSNPVFAAQRQPLPTFGPFQFIYLPGISNNSNKPIQAVRVQYQDYQTSRSEVPTMMDNLTKAHANMVALAVGRVEWTYLKWPGYTQYWSSEVRDTGIDFLSDDSILYKQFGHIDAVIDVTCPNYIKAHPDTAAVNVLGQRSELMVETMDLVEGEYGQLLLNLVDHIATNYPKVDSISITELSYRLDGYGPKDTASYLKYTGRTDWPRQANGQVDIDDPSIGNWRSQIMSGYIKKLADTAHAHGKQLFLDVSMSRNDLARATTENGTNYDLMLQSVDKLVIWGYYYLENYPPEFLQTAANFLTRYGKDRIIMSIGLWGPTSAPMSPDLLIRGIEASVKGGLPNFWITPSIMMTKDLWNVLNTYWPDH